MSNTATDTNGASSELTVEALLEDDHQRIDQMYQDVLDAVVKQKPAMSQKLLFKLFKSALLRHLHWEEKVLFPMYIELSRDEGSVPLLKLQHEEIMVYLEELEEDLSGGLEKSALELLGQYLIHHNEYEEKSLYPAFEALDGKEMKDKLVMAISRGFK